MEKRVFRSVEKCEKDVSVEELFKLLVNGTIKKMKRIKLDNEKKSRIIEMLLLDISLPLIYMLIVDDSFEVLKGQEILIVIKEFLENKFKLQGLKVFKELEGLSYEDNKEFFNLHIMSKRFNTVNINSKYGQATRKFFEIDDSVIEISIEMIEEIDF